MKAMLFAAGLGTRLRPFTDKHPKALARVNGKTLLELNIRYLQRSGIGDVVVNVHHFAGQVEEYLAENNGFGSRVSISDEREQLLETGGGLLHAAAYFRDEEDFVVMNADVLTTMDLRQMISVHLAQRNMATLAVSDRSSSRGLLFDRDMLLGGWTNLRTGARRVVRPDRDLKLFAFSGIQVVSRELLQVPMAGKFSIIDAYLHLAPEKRIAGYDHSGDLFIDAGRPESLQEAARFFT